MKVLIDTTSNSNNNKTYTLADITVPEMGAIQFALGWTAQEVDDEECRKLVDIIEDTEDDDENDELQIMDQHPEIDNKNNNPPPS